VSQVRKPIELAVNGQRVRAMVEPRTHLADFLREQLLLTGTHIGCEHGICGACTVEINGDIARSCITYAVVCDGAEVRTIEGFDDDPIMARLRQAFTEEHALQCGYCTPGMLIAARDLVRRKRSLSRPAIRIAMSGNLCRCTGYMGIVNAIARVMREESAVAVSSDLARAWLGPAPGPGAPAAPAERDPRRLAASAPTERLPPGPAARNKVRVDVGAIAETGGRFQLTQSFVLAHPRDSVWALMSAPQALARCMPGLSLTRPPQDGRLAGRLEVRIGPIRAQFAGDAMLETFAGDYRQRIDGEGSDRTSGSRVAGGVDYRLRALPDASGSEATRVDVTIHYRLSGPLAQFGRAEIARDLARRIGEELAQNIDYQLRNPQTVVEAGPFRGATLLASVLVARLRALLTRIFARR
jgi:carbon-monoxide dehydrogenase small subunit